MKLNATILRLKVKELKATGFTISKIAKQLNISYKHCKNLYEQEKQQ